MNDAIGPVDVSTLQERIYQSLRLSLLRGRFLPGEPMSIRALTRALGTSQMPIREALRRLVAEGALAQSPDRLIRVAPFTFEAHEEIARIRIHIEGFAAERAARTGNRNLVERLRSLNRSMVDAAMSDDMEAAIGASQGFHYEIYAAAQYPKLLEIISNLWLRSGPFLATAQRRPLDGRKLFSTGFRAHDRIVDAIAERDVRAVRLALGADIRSTSFWLRKNYALLESGPKPGA